MSPFDVIYSWQAILIAVCASGFTQLTKRSIDVFRGMKEDADGDGKLTTWEQVGRELRRDAVIINNLILPGLVVFYGACFALMIPARPEIIIDYVKTHAPGYGGYAVYAAWGAVVGQFADYMFMRLKAMLLDIVAKVAKKEETNGNEG